MSPKLLLLNFLLISISTFSQVGIGTVNPKATLEIKASNVATPSNTDGVLIPRINNFPTTNPTSLQDGMLVFSTGVGIPLKGFYYWNQPTLTWIPIGVNSGVKKIDGLLDGKSDANGSSVFLGVQSGLNDDGTSNANVGVGFQSLRANTSGNWNTANGYQSLLNNTTGFNNSAYGYLSLHSNTTGLYNNSFGVNTLFSNTTGQQNIAFGNSALSANTTGNENISIGVNSMRFNTIGKNNTAVGTKSLFSNTTGNNNTANGYQSLYSNTTGISNTAIGVSALLLNTGSQNVASGVSALLNNTTGSHNVASGVYALSKNITGSYNSAIGFDSFLNGVNFSNSTALGYTTPITASNQIRLGNNTVTSIGGFANWTNVSDKRFKKDIKENVKGLDFILKLRPVTYHLDLNKIDNYLKIPDSLRFGKNNEFLKFRNQKKKEVQTGFIAQEVEQAAKDLGYDFSGVDKPKNSKDYYGLRYAEFVVPLVKSVQEQQEIIIALKKENIAKIEVLQKELELHRKSIQKQQQRFNKQQQQIDKLYLLLK